MPETSRGVGRVRKYCKLLLAAVAVALLIPGAALAATNAYGYTYAGQAKCLDCHGGTTGRRQVGAYVDTAHGRFVTDVRATPSALVPAAASQWPSPGFGTGFSFGQSDVWLQLGAPGVGHEYVSVYSNDASHTLSTGKTLGAVAGPADDYWMFGQTFDPEAGIWELGASPATARSYFQSCGGCHNLGLTRPSDKTYALPSGASQSHATPTSYAGLGIQCESCHGTGKAADGDDEHEATGVEIVRTKQVLKSQTCGQCHVTGTAKQKNYAGGTFSNPNGFTSDQALDQYFDVTGAQYIKTGPGVQPTIPTSDAKFYPNGANKGMHHSYYNEWMLTPHARSLRYKNGQLWSASAKDSCLKCHSGEGFLKGLGYGWEGLYQTNDIGVFPSTVASDTLNVECAVCHTIHAKTGEALGLRLPKDELCGRCHNANIAQGQSATAGSRPHHPSREMRSGYGLIGVAPAGEFMAGTACPECHMPMTRETRVSHSFEPMLPGNAKAWGVQEYGDSCTPCHRSRSRDQLQTSIDEWQSDIRTRIASANAAITAAKSRAASETPTGELLIGAAQTNAWFVENDGSNGVHNYPYAKAGLDEAVLLADAVGARFAEIGVTAADAPSGLSMAYGRLVLGDGSPAIGQALAIEAMAAGTTTWRSVGTAVSTATGGFAYAVTPAGTTSYRVVWRPIAGAAIGSVTRTVTMGSTTSIALSATSVRSGGTVRISGGVSPKHASRSVTIQYRIGTAAWRTVAVRTLDANSRYVLSWRPRSACYVRTVFGGDASHTGSKSRALALRVY